MLEEMGQATRGLDTKLRKHEAPGGSRREDLGGQNNLMSWIEGERLGKTWKELHPQKKAAPSLSPFLQLLTYELGTGASL